MQNILSIKNNDFGYFKPYVIAEIGVNHEGSISRAKKMIEQVADAGANAVKFQTYKADLLASKLHSPSYWDTSKEKTTSQFELFSKLDSFTESDYTELSLFAEALNIDFLSTPFDNGSVEFLSKIVPAFKIASADITNIPLIRKIAKQNKPIFLSVGASTHDEIRIAIDTIRGKSDSQIAILHCVLNYPTKAENANLLAIKKLESIFGNEVIIGYSDHIAPSPNNDLLSLKLAVSMGAIVVEKHFTDDTSASGNDHYHSMDHESLKEFIAWLKNTHEMLGNGVPNIQIQSDAITNARRRIFAGADINIGEKLSESNLIPLRGNIGIPISEWDLVLGKKTKVLIKKGDPISLDSIY